MRSPKFLLIVTGIISLLALGACSSGTQTTSTPNLAQTTTAVKPTESASSSPSPTTTKGDSEKGESGNKVKQGGQVIESGAYHLELVTAKEEGSTHLDFFLQKGDNHESIPNAKVTAQVQFPDGTQKSFDLAYDAPEKHYTVKLDSKAAGEYKVAILTDIKGEKVNGRFSFKQ
jgi:hypothetical protein